MFICGKWQFSVKSMGGFIIFKEVKKNAMKDSAEIILGRAHFRIWNSDVLVGGSFLAEQVKGNF